VRLVRADFTGMKGRSTMVVSLIMRFCRPRSSANQTGPRRSGTSGRPTYLARDSVRAQPAMRCAVADQFDLRGPAGGFHRSPDPAGEVSARRPRAGRDPAGVASWASRAPRTAGDGVAVSAHCQLPCRCYSPCKESPALDLPRRPTAGDRPMGVQLGLMGVQLGFHGHLGRFARPRRRCENAGQQRKAVTALS